MQAEVTLQIYFKCCISFQYDSSTKSQEHTFDLEVLIQNKLFTEIEQMDLDITDTGITTGIPRSITGEPAIGRGKPLQGNFVES